MALRKQSKLGYAAATYERSGVKTVAQGGSADYHLRNDLDTLRKASQEFDRNNGLYRGLLSRSIDNILGDGFMVQARTDSDALNTKIEDLWRAYWAAPEVRGLMSGWQMERAVLRSLFTDGDVGALKTKDGRLQVIEAERIASNKTTHEYKRGEKPNIVEQGVELDALGAPAAYWIANYSDWGNVAPSTARRILPQDFLYLANVERPSQTRGFPALTSNFPMLYRLNDVLDSEAVAWQLQSRFALIRQQANAGQQAYQQSAEDTKKTSGEQIPPRYTEFDAGIIFSAEPGEDMKAFDRKIPSMNFTDSVTMYLRLLGLPLGLPLELILLDWSKTNYSSARAALEQAYRMFTCWQRLMIRRFHTPIYEWQIRRWQAAGLLPTSPDLFKHEWITPDFPWLDQEKEANAWGIRLDRGLTTHAQALKAVSRDRVEWIVAREKEITDAIERADALNKKYPDAEVDWRSFAGLAATARRVTIKGQTPAVAEAQIAAAEIGAASAPAAAPAKESEK